MSKKIILQETKEEYLQSVIQIEKDNSKFIGQYDIARHKEVLYSENEKHYSVFDKVDKSLIGYVILSGFAQLNNSIEFRRIAISKKGHGCGRETIKLIKSLCFDKFNAHRLWLDVLSDNYRAIQLYESEGFLKEGLIRDCIKQDDKYLSIWIMSILATDM